jgi:hypothetical protein
VFCYILCLYYIYSSDLAILALSVSSSGIHSGSGLRYAAAGSAENKVMETWHVGAGGAVIILRTAAGEREGMQTKMNGTLGVL